MKLEIDPAMSARYPALRIAYLVATGVDNRGHDAALAARIADAQRAVRQAFATAEDLGRAPEIAAWREIYRSFGANPNRTRPSAEALLRRVVRGDAVPSVSKAVDCYLETQLAYRLPVGGYDLDAVAEPITLRHAAAGEPFVAIGGEASTTGAGEVIYADARRVLTRQWNHRDCDAAKITEASTRIALFVEAPVPAITDAQLDGAIAALAAALATVCHAHVTTGRVQA